MNTAHISASCMFALALVTCAAGASGRVGTVAVQVRPFVAQYRAYAEVQPHALVALKAAATGVINALRVLPGEQVRAGERLARLTGPEYQAELASARARFRAAQTGLRIQQHNYPDFSSAQDVAEAQAMLEQTRTALTRIQAAGELRAPVAGTVVSLSAASGTRVTPGAPVLELLPEHNLWLRATLYGQGAGEVRPGMRGRFQPADGRAAIPVRVRTVIPPQAAGGGVRIACVATTTAHWQDGETGSLTITAGRPRPLPLVPTAALILDQGSWWVLIAHARGLHRQAVAIGPSVGEWTFIRHGLARGERVVAVNAYLLFHADISRHYSPPD